jgi:SAM-dependent methyltransferase
MLTTETSNPNYMLGHSDKELARLGEQARIMGPITRRFFLEAGLAPGMRVLDVGSGAGDVSFLAADIVGDKGVIIGVDRSPIAVGTRRRDPHAATSPPMRHPGPHLLRPRLAIRRTGWVPAQWCRILAHDT